MAAIAMAIDDREGLSPALEAFLHRLHFTASEQQLFEAVYPEPCPQCGSREQGGVDRDGVVRWHCGICGHEKGPAIASPLESAWRRVYDLPSGDQPMGFQLVRDVQSGVIPPLVQKTRWDGEAPRPLEGAELEAAKRRAKGER